MRAELLDYSLPEQAIAQRPAARREDARLLVVHPRRAEHRQLPNWAELVPEGALVVLNDTRVRRARLFARKSSGGNVELLFLEARAISEDVQIWSVLAHASRRLRAGMTLELGPARFTVLERGPGPELQLEVRGAGDPDAFVERYGALPLPPYIRRNADGEDAERYQTVFAERLGSAAAPTAGLHLTRDLLSQLVERGIRVASVTLHVGAGTFLPVRSEDLDDHPMHSEHYEVTRGLQQEVAAARARQAPVVAVGTTVVRALESAYAPGAPGGLRSGAAQTRLLIQPGFRFQVVDALLTNFHAPKTTLLALVSAFIGVRRCAAAYRTALAAQYRFLSYGDAMWLPARMAPDLEPGVELLADAGAARP